MEGAIVLFGEDLSKYSLKTEGPKRSLKALVCKRQAKQNTEERSPRFSNLRSAAESSMLDLEGTASKARLKYFQHFREYNSTPHNQCRRLLLLPKVFIKLHEIHLPIKCLFKPLLFLSQMRTEVHIYLFYQRDPSGSLRVILPHWSLYQSWRIGANSFLETEPKHKPQHVQYWKVSKLRIKPQSFWCT